MTASAQDALNVINCRCAFAKNKVVYLFFTTYILCRPKEMGRACNTCGGMEERCLLGFGWET